MRPPRSNLAAPASPLHSIGLYAISIALVSGSNFLVVPLLVHLLGPQGFARWALLEPALLFATPLAGAGIHYGLMQAISTPSVDRTNILGQLWPLHAITSVLVAAAITALIVLCGFPPALAILCGALVILESGLLLFASLWRAEDKPILYALVEGGRSLALLLILLAIATLLVGTVETYLLIRLGLAAIACAAALAIVRPSWRPNAATARQAIAYGGPIVLASAASAWLLSIDRYAIATMTTEPELTAYVAHMKVAQVLVIGLMAPFYAWFAPQAMRRLADPASHHFFIKTTSIYAVILAWVAVNFWIIAGPLWAMLFPSIALDRRLFAILLIGAVIFAMGNPLSIGSLRPGKTYQSLLVTLAAMLVATALCFGLAPFGPEGVAAGRLAGLATYTGLFAYTTTRALGIRYPWRRYALLGLASITTCALFETLWPAGSLLEVAAKLLLVNAIAAAGFFRFHPKAPLHA